MGITIFLSIWLLYIWFLQVLNCVPFLKYFQILCAFIMQVNDVKLGTMMGVFVPCLQNILGIIYYIRFTW